MPNGNAISSGMPIRPQAAALDQAREELRARAQQFEAELARPLWELRRTRIELTQARKAANQPAD